MTDTPEEPDDQGFDTAGERGQRPARQVRPPARGSSPVSPDRAPRGGRGGGDAKRDGQRRGDPPGANDGVPPDRASRGRPAAGARGGPSRGSADRARRGRGDPRPPRPDSRSDARGQREIPVDQPFRPRRKPGPRRPILPEERPFLPREAFRDLKASVAPSALDDVVKAVAGAAEALEQGSLDMALELLAWAKSTAPRSPTVRESLGIALYTAERYHEAHSELLAYRRLSAAQDQNHLLADCARALGRQDKVVEYVEEMMAAGVEPARVAEGLMVVAGERADRGDLDGALETLHRADLDPPAVQGWHPRLWYLAGDLCERLGRVEKARDYFEAILAIDPEFGDADQRLSALD